MTRTLREFAAEQVDSFIEEHEGHDPRDEVIDRWQRHLVNGLSVPDDIVAAMPEVSRHNAPQDSPQEYDCGCVAMTRITDRDYRYGEKPFEMRLALPCAGETCELAHLRGNAR